MSSPFLAYNSPLWQDFGAFGLYGTYFVSLDLPDNGPVSGIWPDGLDILRLAKILDQLGWQSEGQPNYPG